MQPTLQYAVTPDGWRIALHRYALDAPRATDVPLRRHAVVLCHGLGANHRGFDLDHEISLARHLARRGFEVFAIDLRGHGMSDMPSLRGPKRYGWAFDDYLLRDVPAAIAHAARLAGREGVHWIGHSMGGLLLYAHLANGGSRDIRSGIAVGSSLDYSGSASGFHSIMPLRAVLARVPAVPLGLAARVSGRLASRMQTPFEKFNVWRTNVDPALWRTLCATGFHTVSAPVFAQLATAMLPRGLTSRDGSIRYGDSLHLATAPVLGLAGDRDPQCPPDAARDTLDALGSLRRELKVFGPEHGHADHYSHWDMLIGLRVKTEVFPHIDAWLDEHD